MPRKLAAGNWKMNGAPADLAELRALGEAHPNPGCDVLICPPAPLVASFAAAGLPMEIGGQDCHAAPSGAHTGDVSAELLKTVGASAVILGHSERRTDHGETSADVSAKVSAAQAAGLLAIVCVGESEAEKDAGRTIKVVGGQIAGSLPESTDPASLVIAYEPIWAIGTGRTPTLDDIKEVHASIREALVARFAEAGNEIRILYGGSVKPGNAAEIFAIANVDGGLVGGASLKAADFGPIVAAAEA